ncbi:MAG: hypothetical protein KJN90_04845 [Gammaproteobacteria bacterium]|nr:hypothetical protein [Gammaproteobacteria bacterium]
MTLIHQFAFYLHVTFGACALLLFWVPVFTRKGNTDHKRFGRIFASAMYAVSASGATMASLDLIAPLAMHATTINPADPQAPLAAGQIRASAMFLFSLSVLVFTSTRQGWLAIIHKADRQPLRHPLHLGLCGLLIAVGVILFITGLRVGSVLFMVFALLEIASGVGRLRYNLKSELNTKEWWIEHLNGLIGSGIGAYTAFFVFGGSRLLSDLFGNAFANGSLFLWLAPGVIGSIAIAVLSRKYRARFNGGWVMKRAALHSDLVR